MFRSPSTLIVPATRNTTIRGPPVSNAARRLPSPLSSRFVTAITLPPRPPVVHLPPPHAPGNPGLPASGNRGGSGGICPRSGSVPCCALTPAPADKSASKSKLFFNDLCGNVLLVVIILFIFCIPFILNKSRQKSRSVLITYSPALVSFYRWVYDMCCI